MGVGSQFVDVSAQHIDMSGCWVAPLAYGPDPYAFKIIRGNFSYANFSNIQGNLDTLDVDFTNANFTGAKFGWVDFTGANFTGVNFTGASLLAAVATKSIFTNVTWSNTICPDGTNSDGNTPKTCVGHFILTPF